MESEMAALKVAEHFVIAGLSDDPQLYREADTVSIIVAAKITTRKYSPRTLSATSFCAAVVFVRSICLLKKVLTKVLKASPISHLVSSLSFYFLLKLYVYSIPYYVHIIK